MKTTKDSLQPLSIKVMLLLLTSVISISVLYQFNWSGFGEGSNKSKSIEKTIKDGKIISLKETESEYFQSGKTLWDWLGLTGTLAIPIVIFQFQANEQRRAENQAKFEKEQAEELAKVEKQQAEQRESFEKDIAEANLREEAFQVYIDRMSGILINNSSRSELFPHENETKIDNPVRDVARIRTVTILRRLENDTERRDRVLHFLQDTELLQFLLRTANLAGINLSSANLSGANLSNANLAGINLSSANLSSAILCNANLSGANLSNANLNNANLNFASFPNANLTNANLENSYIKDTKFINTELNNAILVSARTWDEIDIDNNFEEIYHDNKYELPYIEERFYETDFKGAKLTNADIKYTNFKAAINLTSEQLKLAKNWDEGTYSNDLLKMLGLPKSLQLIKSEGENFEKMVGYQVEVRSYSDKNVETITKGEITGFSKSTRHVNVKTSNGEQLDKLELFEVYVYIT